MVSTANALSSEGLYFQPSRPSRGVRNLAMGILVQAVRDIVPKSASNTEWKEWQQDALDWFLSDNENPGSFLWVSEILNVAPVRIRNWLKTFMRAGREDQVRMASRLIHFRVTR